MCTLKRQQKLLFFITGDKFESILYDEEEEVCFFKNYIHDIGRKIMKIDINVLAARAYVLGIKQNNNNNLKPCSLEEKIEHNKFIRKLLELGCKDHLQINEEFEEFGEHMEAVIDWKLSGLVDTDKGGFRDSLYWGVLIKRFKSLSKEEFEKLIRMINQAPLDLTTYEKFVISCMNQLYTIPETDEERRERFNPPMKVKESRGWSLW